MQKTVLGMLTAALMGAFANAHAADVTAVGPQGAAAEICQAARESTPQADRSVTLHSLSIGGTGVAYVATAGKLVIRDDNDRPIANIGYVAYTKRDPKDSKQRPIIFAFNGGPGWSSLWLHVGWLGPKRVLVSDLRPTPAPYRIVDNEFSVLDKSDLVMIDPIGTGLSRAICNHKDEDFWSVDTDVDSLSRFIAQYVSDTNRWSSPKYLLGESYGTTRAAAIVNYLRVQRSLTFNGLILASVATDPEAVFTHWPGNDRPYALYLPAYAAVAWYHHTLPEKPEELEPFLEEVRRYAMGAFTAALMKGDELTEAERLAVAEQVHKYTGLPVDYLEAANLRVAVRAFTHELLRSQRKIVGRLDGRFVGAMTDPLAKDSDYDAAFAEIGAPYTAAFMDYLHGELKFGGGKTYWATRDIGSKWIWTHQPIDASKQPIVNSGVDLAQAMEQDANLRVLVLNGYFDLATPFSATEYMMAHLGVPPNVASRIQMRYYKTGHMIYVNPVALKRLKNDLDAFIDSTAPP